LFFCLFVSVYACPCPSHHSRIWPCCLFPFGYFDRDWSVPRTPLSPCAFVFLALCIDRFYRFECTTPPALLSVVCTTLSSRHFFSITQRTFFFFLLLRTLRLNARASLLTRSDRRPDLCGLSPENLCWRRHVYAADLSFLFPPSHEFCPVFVLTL